MSVTSAAIHGGYEIEPTPAPTPLAVAISRSGTYAFEIADQAMGPFRLELRGHRSTGTHNRTETNLEGHGRRAETCRCCSADSRDNADSGIPSIACEGRR